MMNPEKFMCLGIPVKIVELDASGEYGKVDYLGTRVQTSFALLPRVGLGDWVIVHAGFAISRLDEEEARETLDLLREIAEKADDGPLHP
jgi:hydrogenase expression/formation protein HypC